MGETMNYKILIAAALIAVGCLFLSNSVGLQLINEGGGDPEHIVELGDAFPGGRQSAPSETAAGNTAILSLAIGTDDINYRYWTVKVSISPYGTSSIKVQNVDLHFSNVKNIANSDIKFLANYQGTWLVPYTESDQMYIVDWTITSGSEFLASMTTYCRASPIPPVEIPENEQPDGDFTVNGQAVDSDDNVISNDGKLTFTFIPTKASSSISKVYIEVWEDGKQIDTVQLSKSSGSYTGSYSLPDYGFYTLKGYIQPISAASSPIQTLSIFMDNSGTDVDTGDLAPFIGVGLVIGGIMVISSSRRK